MQQMKGNNQYHYYYYLNLLFPSNATLFSAHPFPRLGAYSAARNSSTATELEEKKRAASRIRP